MASANPWDTAARQVEFRCKAHKRAGTRAAFDRDTGTLEIHCITCGAQLAGFAVRPKGCTCPGPKAATAS